jgi:hypothetical protein
VFWIKDLGSFRMRHDFRRENLMALWAASMMASREHRDGWVVRRHNVATACLVEAASRDEALGKAWRIARKHLRPEDGFMDHVAVVSQELVSPGEVKPFDVSTLGPAVKP